MVDDAPFPKIAAARFGPQNHLEWLIDILNAKVWLVTVLLVAKECVI